MRKTFPPEWLQPSQLLHATCSFNLICWLVPEAGVTLRQVEPLNCVLQTPTLIRFCKTTFTSPTEGPQRSLISQHLWILWLQVAEGITFRISKIKNCWGFFCGSRQSQLFFFLQLLLKTLTMHFSSGSSLHLHPQQCFRSVLFPSTECRAPGLYN